MKIAVLSELASDDIAIRIIVEAVLGQQIEPIPLPLRVRGWPAIFTQLPILLKYLHYRTDADAVVVVVDSDNSSLHETGHEHPGQARFDCRLCMLKFETEKYTAMMKPVHGRSTLKFAVGVSVPAIEAWYLCGNDHRASEAAWKQNPALRGAKYRTALKRAVYGSHPTPVTLKEDRAKEAAGKLAQDISQLETYFPGGFGSLVRAIRNW